MKEFRDGSIKAKGAFDEWPASSYGISKAAVIVATKIFAQQEQQKKNGGEAIIIKRIRVCACVCMVFAY